MMGSSGGAIHIANHPQAVMPIATCTVTSVSVSPSVSTQLLASNPGRKGFLIYNAGSKDVYVTLGSTTTANLFSAVLPLSSLFDTYVNYTGPISALSTSGTQILMVTEY